MRHQLGKLARGLEKTRAVLGEGLRILQSSHKEYREEALNDLEDLLLQADVGISVAARFRSLLERHLVQNRNAPWNELITVLRTGMIEMLQTLESSPLPDPRESSPPHVVLVAGVNGSGKTTVAGKLAHYYADLGYRVMMGAADTFRAAASEQLEIWARRTGADLVKQRPGADPASVAYDAVSAARARGHDVVIIDTAGRLQTRVNLMKELEKIRRVVDTAHPGAPHQALLVLDATVGQNALSQARLFHEALQIDGLVLAKIDGTAKGGAIFPIAEELRIPVRWVGVGEHPEDLEPFSPEAFVDALLLFE
jgi:fused signal recognition particle receptor